MRLTSRGENLRDAHDRELEVNPRDVPDDLSLLASSESKEASARSFGHLNEDVLDVTVSEGWSNRRRARRRMKGNQGSAFAWLLHEKITMQ